MPVYTDLEEAELAYQIAEDARDYGVFRYPGPVEDEYADAYMNYLGKVFDERD